MFGSPTKEIILYVLSVYRKFVKVGELIYLSVYPSLKFLIANFT